MTQHTPGPWIVTDAISVVTDWSKVGFLTTVANCRIGGGTHSEQAATARLIAAAPELLEALKVARHTIKTDVLAESRMPALVLAKLDAAIAKAEGRA